MQQPIDSLLDKWCTHMRGERLTPRTIHFYRETIHAVAAILETAERPHTPKEIRPSDVRFLLDYLADHDYAVQTRRGYISSLRRWCKWGGNRSLDRWPKARFPADTRPNVDWLTPDQTAQLLAHDKTPLQAVVIALELREGLRHVEVIRLRGSDIDWQEHLMQVSGKGPIGGKPRIVPLVPETEDAIRAWSKIRAQWVREGRERYPRSFLDPEELIVWRRSGKLHPYSEEGYGLDKVVTLKISSEIGFSFSNHTLRRTFGRALYRADVPVATIAQILGHESTEVTLRYIGVGVDDMRDAMQRRIFDVV